MGSDDEALINQLRELHSEESDDQVRVSMSHVIAVFDLSSDEPDRRNKALEVASGQLHPEFLNALRAVSTSTADPELKQSVDSLLESAHRKKRIYGLLETIFSGSAWAQC